MFYLSERRDGKYGVTDTTDNVTERYTLEELVNICDTHNIFILGLNIPAGKAELMTEVGAKLFELKEGTPLRLKYSKSLPEKQVIYGGYHFDVSRRVTLFSFFDASGLTGRFDLSSKYLFEHKDNIKIDLENNDAVEVARLIKQLKG